MKRSFVVDFDQIVSRTAGQAQQHAISAPDTAFVEVAEEQIRQALDRAARRTAQQAAKRFALIWKRVAAAIAHEWRQTLPVLAARGWYLDGGLSPEQVRIVVEMMNGGRDREADKLLIAYFDRSMKRIEEELVESFPRRRTLIRSAFAAHRQRRYSLAIPIMLAQADGMCAEALGSSLFMFRERQEIGNRIARADAEWQAITAPLLTLGTLVTPTRNRPLGADEFNRHAILHGLIVHYGTHRNSCRAISLLSYVNVVISRWKESSAKPHRAG